MTARGGLGRGLGALIPVGARALEEIPISDIYPNAKQPRRQFDEERMGSLAASIRRLGLLQPVVVRRTGSDSYELVMGERRWRAAQRAGLPSVPAVIIETDDRGSLERALVENIHRQDLNPIEEAAAYKQLLEEAALTHEDLAEKLGLSRPSVSNALRLLELPDPIQKMVMENRLTAGHARALLGLAGHPLLERIAQKVAAAGLSVRQTEELVRRQAAEMPGGLAGREAPGRRRRDPGLAELGEKIGDFLQTRVRVTKGRGKGKIVIEFGSSEDLERIARRLGAEVEEQPAQGAASIEPAARMENDSGGRGPGY